MEVTRGFINIPKGQRAELLESVTTSFQTKLNGYDAYVDVYGRLWSHYLKDRFPVNTEVILTKNVCGF